MRTTQFLALTLLAAACKFAPSTAVDPDSGTVPEVDAPRADAASDGPLKPWLRPWSRRKEITLHESQIEAPGGNGTLANFPVLISVTDPQIGTATAFDDGQDIVFTLGNATTVLASEIERFDRASNQLVAWVQVPSLSETTDTKLYIYYGNPDPGTRTPASEDVWSASYLAVWHLHQDPGPGRNGDIRDSTSSNRDGTADPAMVSADSVPARIGRGLSFDGMNKFLNFDSMSFGNMFTISMWLRFNGGNNVKALFANSGTGTNTDGFRFFVNTVGTEDHRLIFETGAGGLGSGRIAQTAMNAIPVDTFTHVAAVVNRTAATALLYVNGASAAIDTSITNNFEIDSDFEIGRMENNVVHFPGLLDEVRVANTLRPPEWIQTSFNNQSQPADFHTLGAEEQDP